MPQKIFGRSAAVKVTFTMYSTILRPPRGGRKSNFLVFHFRPYKQFLLYLYALCVWGGGGFFGDDYLESAFVTSVRIAPPLRVRLGVRLHSVRPRTSLVANGAIHIR